MMKLTTLAAAAASALAAPHHNTMTFDAAEFKHLGAAHADELVRFSAGLPWRNFEVLQSELSQISDPSHPRYGQWMTQEQVLELTGPEPALRAEAKGWLANAGASCSDLPHGLRCVSKVSAAERIFGTQLSAFEHTAKAGARVLRVHPKDAYSFPAPLAGSVEFVSGLTDFPTVRRRMGRAQAFGRDGKPTNALRAAKKATAGATDYIVTVETLYALYGNTTGGAGAIQAPAEFQDDQSYNPGDLKKFAAANGLSLWNITKKVGPFAPSNPDLEATLDEQYIGAMGKGNTNWYWTETEWQYEFTQAIAAAPDSGVPNVFSVSWGWSEADQCTIDQSGPCSAGGAAGSKAYVLATNKGFAAAGARGISILVSSGDSGAHGRTDPSCSTPKTHPDWPTASPYITAVGATQLTDGTPIAAPNTPWCKAPPAGLPKCAGGGTEVVCSVATGALVVSGGGFSNYEPTQTWQAASVKAYLASGAELPGTGNFNASGRAYPDIAALGHNYIILASDQPTQVDGTSCSAPVMGGIIATANGQRIAAGKKALGFLNPAIYQIAAADPTVFNDITSGNNKCTEDGCGAKCTGYGAVKGWDAVTGFGTPQVPKLVAALVALP